MWFLEPYKNLMTGIGWTLFLVFAFLGLIPFFSELPIIIILGVIAACLIFFALLYWGFFYAAPFKPLRDLIKWAYNGVVLGVIIGVVPALERAWQDNGVFVAVLLVDPVLLILALLIPYLFDNVYRKWRGLPQSSVNPDTLPSVQELPFSLDGDKTWKAQGALSRQEILEFAPYKILVNMQPADFDNRSGYWDQARLSPSATPDDESIEIETFLKNGTRVGAIGLSAEYLDPLMQVVNTNNEVVCEGSLGRCQDFILEMARRFRQDIITNQDFIGSLWHWRKLFDEFTAPSGEEALRFAPYTIWAFVGTSSTATRLEPTEVNLAGKRIALSSNPKLHLWREAPAEICQCRESEEKRVLFRAESLRSAELHLVGLYADERLRMMDNACDTPPFWAGGESWERLNSSPIEMQLEWEDGFRYSVLQKEWGADGFHGPKKKLSQMQPNNIILRLGRGTLIELSSLAEAEAFILERYLKLHSSSV
jgi:hypothetical protein